jgi:hypothetical protein
MKTLVLLIASFCFSSDLFAQDQPAAADATKPPGESKTALIADSATVLADAVIKASGGEKWPRVKTLDFTFNVQQGGKTLMSAKHHWDVAAGRDSVEWSGKKVDVDVTGSFAINAGEKMNNADQTLRDQQEAHKRWTNDSYWLLAPLKLRDKGVHLADKGEQQIEGKNYRVLEVSFESVGLTPKDKYNLYVDPESNLVRRWDYMPAPDRKSSATWDGYQDFNGLKLATEHKTGDTSIVFTDVRAATE